MTDHKPTKEEKRKPDPPEKVPLDPANPGISVPDPKAFPDGIPDEYKDGYNKASDIPEPLPEPDPLPDEVQKRRDLEYPEVIPGTKEQ